MARKNNNSNIPVIIFIIAFAIGLVFVGIQFISPSGQFAASPIAPACTLLTDDGSFSGVGETCEDAQLNACTFARLLCLVSVEQQTCPDGLSKGSSSITSEKPGKCTPIGVRIGEPAAGYLASCKVTCEVPCCIEPIGTNPGEF